MDPEKISPVIGSVLLVIGIVILFFTFFQAMGMINNVGDYFDEQLPEEEDLKKPTANFFWNANDLSVDFSDESEEGDGGINSWDWVFGDGDSGSGQNPQHAYNQDGNYRVTLRIQDSNGLTDTTYTEIYVENGNSNNGETEGKEGDFDFSLSLDIFAVAILAAILYLIMFLVGAALVKAGWNLLKTGPSVVKLKIKPKKLEVEQAEQPRQFQPPPPRAQPPPDYYPPRREQRSPYPEPPVEDWDEPDPESPRPRAAPPKPRRK
jgi:PKD repeat protein